MTSHTLPTSTNVPGPRGPLGQPQPRQDRRRVIIFTYTRLSKDPRFEREDHATQNRLIAPLFERNSAEWAGAEIRRFSDDDQSASKEEVIRPNWERMLDEIRAVNAKEAKVILVGYKQDRMMRLVEDLPMVCKLLERKRGELWTASESQVSIKRGGRVGYYIQGVVAANESEVVSMRTSDGIETAAMNGKPHGVLGFGWRAVRDEMGKHIDDVINEPEAEILRGVVARLLEGKSLAVIARDLNEAGIPAPGAGRLRNKYTGRQAASEWLPQKIRQLVLRPANIGIRTHKQGSGEDATVTEYPGRWPAILDEDDFRNVRALLSDPKRRTCVSNIPVHLLSGIATCAVCGERVTSQLRSKKGTARAYRCSKSHVVRTETQVDAVVREYVLTVVSDPEIRAEFLKGETDEVAQAHGRKAAIEADMAALSAAQISRQITMAQFLAMNSALMADLEAIEAVLNRRRDGAAFEGLLRVRPQDVASAWDAMSLDRRRSIISALVTVEIHKSTKRGKKAFDPTTVVVELRGM